ncbi:MAG TPA: tetratricopeptide repeat protein [Candidatus Saccharimonadales bacterium]|nr:tetratricopeptide repeat protein [Candidatus Saccharimonadales bacterium]
MSGEEKSAEPDNGLVAKKSPWWFGLRSPWLYLMVVVILVVIGVGLIIYTKHQDNNNPKVQALPFNVVMQQSQSLTNISQYAAAETLLRNYLNTDPSQNNKRDAYVQLATIYTNASDYRTAISYYQQANSIDKTPHLDTTEGLAYAYQQMGDKTQSIHYYKQAISILQGMHNPYLQSVVQNMQYQLSQLQGGA